MRIVAVSYRIYGLGINGLESERWFLSATSSFFIDFSFFSTTSIVVGLNCLSHVISCQWL